MDETGLRSALHGAFDTAPTPLGTFEGALRGLPPHGSASGRHRLAAATAVAVVLASLVPVGLALIRPNSRPHPVVPVVVPSTSPEPTPSPSASPAPQSQVLADEHECTSGPLVTFSSSGVGLVSVGGYRSTETIIRSANRAQWRPVLSQPGTVCAGQWLDQTNVVLIDTAGVLWSADSGITWQRRATRDDLTGGWFLTPLVGYVTVGLHARTPTDIAGASPAPLSNRLLRTVDGGRTFVAVDAGMAVATVYFTDKQHGWVAGATGIAATADGGYTWRRQVTFHPAPTTFPGPVAEPYAGASMQLSFSGRRDGFLLIQGLGAGLGNHGTELWSTADGGNKWIYENYQGYIPSRVDASPAATQIGMPQDLGNLVTRGPASATALEGNGISAMAYLQATTDGGRTWVAHRIPAVITGEVGNWGITGLTFFGSRAWAVGTVTVGNPTGGPSTQHTDFVIVVSNDNLAHVQVQYSRSLD